MLHNFLSLRRIRVVSDVLDRSVVLLKLFVTLQIVALTGVFGHGTLLLLFLAAFLRDALDSGGVLEERADVLVAPRTGIKC